MPRRVRLPSLVSGIRQDILVVLGDARFTKRALADSARFGPEIVYERSEYLCRTGSRVSARLGVPLVLEVNGRLAQDVRTQYRSPLEPLGAAMERAKLRRADAIVTVSPGLAEILVGFGARADRVLVIPNSVPDDRVTGPRRPLNRAPTIGWVGHLMRWHFEAVTRLIDVAPDVLRELPAARFLVIGGGPGLEQLRAQARALGVDRCVELTGPVSYESVACEIARVDIGVIPEIFDYAFPVKLAEFGAAGAAVIAPRSPSLDRQLEPGIEYEPFVPGDRIALVRAVVGLARDPNRVAELGAALQRAVQDRFTWSATGRQLGDAIDRVLDGRRYSRAA